MKTKILFLIADGMGDLPLAELGHRTPMQAARTPNMDTLAGKGLQGLCRTIPEHLPPGSDTANMALLGYDPATHHTGRGPIEAAAQGLDLGDRDLVWRLNLVTVTGWAEDGLMRDYSAGPIDSPTAKALILRLQQALGDEVFRFVPGVQYRHLLVQKDGADMPGAGVTIRPPHDITDQPIAPDLATLGAIPGLDRLTSRAPAILTEDNPSQANAVWPWGQGRRLSLPEFKTRFDRLGAVVSAVDLVRGLGRAAGLEVLDVPGVTGLLDTNYEGKVAAALDFLTQGDFVYLHVEAPDECGHAGNIKDKIEAIERFDARIVGPLLQVHPPDRAAILVTCDHRTPIAVRTHVHDPVPFVLAAPGVRPEAPPVTFDEDAAAKTGLHISRGEDLLPWVLDRVQAAGAGQ